MTVLWTAWVVLLMMVMVSLAPHALVKEQCAKFEFQTAKKDVTTDNANYTVTVAENKRTRIMFRLNIDGCMNRSQVFTITVAKKKKNRKNFKYVCKFRVGGSQVSSFSNKCKEDGEGWYSLVKRMNRSHRTLWRWRASYDGAASESLVRFNVTYPPRITNLTVVKGKTVTPGSSVDVVCRYKKGNPDVTPRLTDAHGRELRATKSPGEVRHTVGNVSCEDTGKVHCQAPGAKKNRSRMLIVQCPPRFQWAGIKPKHFMVEPDKPRKLTFQVRSHTDDLSACWLYPWPPIADKKDTDCLSIVDMSGPPRNKKLRLGLSNVTSVNKGTWRLNITNDGGSDDVEFEIQFPIQHQHVPSTPSDPSRTTVVSPEKREDDEERGPVVDTVIAIIVLIVVVVALAIVGVFLLSRRYRIRFSSLCRLCARRCGAAQRRQQHQIRDLVVYSPPEVSGSHSGSSPRGGEVTFSHQNQAPRAPSLSPSSNVHQELKEDTP